MLTWGHNEAISMDATFGGNDVKFHLLILMVVDSQRTGILLILMVFDSQRTKIPDAWIVILRQTQNDLIEWLAPLKVKLFSRMPGWKLACFIVDDAPQELATLW